jgi:hypothetical protein
VYCKGKSRALILAGTTNERMGVNYYRFQSESIYQPDTIGDIPFEVIQKALRLVRRADLVSASLSCRAWRQAAVEVIVAVSCLNKPNTRPKPFQSYHGSSLIIRTRQSESIFNQKAVS